MKRWFSMCSLLSLVLVMPAYAVDDHDLDLLTIEDSFDLETTSDPQISPDGDRIVYVRNEG